eukprot:scaffold20673_cov66-Phaeocystis_antarctica.AAC.8
MEGGWPKDIDPTEKDQTARYRKKVARPFNPLPPSCHPPANPRHSSATPPAISLYQVEKDEEYLRQIKSLADELEASLMQACAHSPCTHHALAMHTPCTRDARTMHTQRRLAECRTTRWTSMRTTSRLTVRPRPPPTRRPPLRRSPPSRTRRRSSARPAASAGSRMAAGGSPWPSRSCRRACACACSCACAYACARARFQDWRIERASNASYIWDVNSPNEPEMALHPVASLCCLDAYNPKQQDLLVGGLYNGLVSFWDTRKGPNPVETSVIECSHRDPVYDICWLAGKTATDCVSTSTDGQVLRLCSLWLCSLWLCSL